MANIDKVKRCFSLCKALHEFFQIILVVNTAIPLHGLAEAIEVGDNFGNNFSIVSLSTLLRYRLAEGIRSSLPAFETLFHVFFFELDRGTVNRNSVV